MNRYILSLVALLLLTFTGCDKKEKSKETFKSYEYYKAHTQEMLVRFNECEKINYIMSGAETKDCKNASSAKYLYNAKKERNEI